MSDTMQAGFGRRRGPRLAVPSADVLRARCDQGHLRSGRRLVRGRDDPPRRGRPITTGSATNFAISLEKLIAADPELILLGDAAYGVTADQVAARPGWKVMTAVENGAIRPVNDLIVTRPGPRLVQGLRELALAIHPDLVLPSAAPIPPMP
jgi:hypothetical protein